MLFLAFASGRANRQRHQRAHVGSLTQFTGLREDYQLNKTCHAYLNIAHSLRDYVDQRDASAFCLCACSYGLCMTGYCA